MFLRIVGSEKPPFEEVYAQHYDRVVQYLYGKLNNWSEAEDLAAESFEYCLTHYDSYDPDKSAVTTWLYLVVNSRLKNRYRDAKSVVDIEDVIGVIPDDSSPMEASVELDELRAGVQKALNKLPERQREIVYLSYFEDKSSAEIAEIMGMTPGNVRVVLSRALDKMKTLCAGLLEEE